MAITEFVQLQNLIKAELSVLNIQFFFALTLLMQSQQYRVHLKVIFILRNYFLVSLS